MEQNEIVYIKYENGQAIITDNLDDNADVKISYNIHRPICAEIIPHNESEVPVYLLMAEYSMMQGYTGENKETFDRFVNLMINRINNGLYLNYILNRLTYNEYFS